MSDPTNTDRASWAAEGLDRFCDFTGQRVDEEPDDIVCDFLCDLMHWCRREHISWGLALSRAERHFEEEVEEEEKPCEDCAHYPAAENDTCPGCALGTRENWRAR